MRGSLIGGLAIAVLLAGTGPVSGQIPDEFEDLQVLPKDIGKRELVSIMREFAGALGVRCSHCHVQDTEGSLEGMDFASNELEHKKVARAMMKITQEINSKLLPTIGRSSHLRVRCVTCHRGVEKPEGLDTILMTAIEKDGVSAAISRYDELRGEYYGSGSYDFGPGTLNGVAEELAGEKNDVPGAIELMRVNLKHNPDAVYSHMMLGQLLAANGDMEAAIASIEKALELEPGNRRAKQMLERLRSPK